MARSKRMMRKLITPEGAELIRMMCKPLPFPKRPWSLDEAHELWERSNTFGHRLVIFKCKACSLEFEVRTWRDSDVPEEVARPLKFCPECGMQGELLLMAVEQEIGPICTAHPWGG